MKLTTKISFFILTAMLFVGCGDNTETKITPDIASIKINETNITINSTDNLLQLTATVRYEDNSTSQATHELIWENTDYTVLSMYAGQIQAVANGGESNVSAVYGELIDTVNIKVNTLESGSLSMAPLVSEINSTGTYDFLAKGDFMDVDTNSTVESNVTIERNIIWSATNGGIITYTDNNVSIQLLSGETNVTAIVFANTTYDMNITKTYNID